MNRLYMEEGTKSGIVNFRLLKTTYKMIPLFLQVSQDIQLLCSFFKYYELCIHSFALLMETCNGLLCTVFCFFLGIG
jgi:hypothetical protein